MMSLKTIIQNFLASDLILSIQSAAKAYNKKNIKHRLLKL